MSLQCIAAVSGLRRIVIAFVAIVLSAGGTLAKDGDLVWGVNGHPLVSYHGVAYEHQLDLVKALGATSYRVDVSSLLQATPLDTLVSMAESRGITILPVLVPPVSLDKETPGEVYRKAQAFAAYFASRFKDRIKVWELGNEMENYAILQPCDMQDDGKQYNCDWGPAGGVTALEYHGGRWAKVSAALKGMSDALIKIDPTLRKAMGTAGWGHIGAFERMQQDGIQWDISVWHYYGGDIEWALKRLVKFGKPIWLTEFNHPYGSQKDGVVKQAEGLAGMIGEFRSLRATYNLEAAHIYELLDETYWQPNFEGYMGLVYLKKDPQNKWVTDGGKPAFCAVRALLHGGFRLAGDAKSKSPPETRAQPHRQCNLCYFDPHDRSAVSVSRYSTCLMLGRLPEAAEVEKFGKELDGKKDGMSLLAFLAESDEFRARYKLGELDEVETVTLFYRLLFDRDPDGMGLGDFVGELKSGRMSKHQLLLALMGSPEFKAHHPILIE